MTKRPNKTNDKKLKSKAQFVKVEPKQYTRRGIYNSFTLKQKCGVRICTHVCICLSVYFYPCSYLVCMRMNGYLAFVGGKSCLDASIQNHKHTHKHSARTHSHTAQHSTVRARCRSHIIKIYTHPIHGHVVACMHRAGKNVAGACWCFGSAHSRHTYTHLWNTHALCVSFRNSWIKIDAQDENIFSSFRNIVHFTSINISFNRCEENSHSLGNISCGLVICFVAGILPLNRTLQQYE